MARAYYAPPADADLFAIGSHIAKDNPVAAMRLTEELQAVCDLLATQPEMSEKAQTQRFGEVRRHVIGNYLIYYRGVDDGVEILRVVHGA